MPDLDDNSRADHLTERLTAAGVTVVAGWLTNAANLVHAKTMPVSRCRAFVTSGAGISPVYSGYSLDASIQFTPFFTAVGDLRMRLDPAAVVVLGDGLAVGPTNTVTQDGGPDPADPRRILRAVADDVRSLGLEPVVGHELEFAIVAPDGSALAPPAWTPYGLGPVLDRAEVVTEIATAATGAGLSLEQVHAEYGPNQFEISLAPADPVRAADDVILAKTIVGRVLRRHGLLASFSPVPFAGLVGSGAHQHFSLLRNRQNIFSGRNGPHGISDEGGHAIAGVLDGLIQAQGLLAGSVLSGSRLLPGMWSGASVCWGAENREAAVRFLRGGIANPHGANVEVKVIDPSANPYLSSAVVLGLAADGIRRELPLPAETVEDPSKLDDAARDAAGLQLLSPDPGAALDALEASELVTRILGKEVVAALLAVRRHELEVYGDLEPEERCARLRLAWTV